jgi:hypothetical protein
MAHVAESFTMRARSENAIDDNVIRSTTRLLREQQRHRVVVVRDDSRKVALERLAREHARVPVEATVIAQDPDMQTPLDELYARASAEPNINAASPQAQVYFFRHMLYQGMLQYLYETAEQEGMMTATERLDGIRRIAVRMADGFSAHDMQEFARMSAAHPGATIYQNMWDFLNSRGRIQEAHDKGDAAFSPGEMNDLLERPSSPRAHPQENPSPHNSPEFIIPPDTGGPDTSIAGMPSAETDVRIASNIPASA